MGAAGAAIGLDVKSGVFPHGRCAAGFFYPRMACSVKVQPPLVHFGAYMLRGDRPIGHFAPSPHSYGLQLRGFPLQWKWGSLPGWPARRACVVVTSSFLWHLVFPAQAWWRSRASWWDSALVFFPRGSALFCATRRTGRGRAFGRCDAGVARCCRALRDCMSRCGGLPSFFHLPLGLLLMSFLHTYNPRPLLRSPSGCPSASGGFACALGPRPASVPLPFLLPFPFQ